MLRILGYTPWHYDKSNNPSIYRFDNELGWISKSGKYSMSVSKSNKDIFEMTIENDSSRKIYGNPSENKILFLGGSFTQGWGVNDNETFANYVQKDFKNYQIKNFGQGGYGSVQSYLLLKRLFNKGAKPKLVVYSFIDHHEYRNVARGEWLRLLLKYSNSGHETPPRVPFATVGKNNLINFHKPVAYPMFPLRETLSLVNFLEFNYAKITTKRRKKMQKDVLRKLLLEMKKISDTTNSVFLFVNLKSEISEHENCEILVIDSNSSDETSEIAKQTLDKSALDRKRWKIITAEKPGKSHAVNLALRICKSEIIIMIDADVTLEPGWLKKFQISLATKNVGVASGIEIRNENQGNSTRQYYRSYSNKLRSLESSHDTTPVLEGGLISWRKSALEDFLLDEDGIKNLII